MPTFLGGARVTIAHFDTSPRALSLCPGASWRRLRAAVALAAALALAGCDGAFFGTAPTSMSVAEGAVVLAGPPGFCVDQNASHAGFRGAFVVFGSCASISGKLDAGRPPIRAVLTAAVSAGTQGGSVQGSQRQLARFFRSPAGRKMLSRSGDPGTVRVLGIGRYDSVMVVHIRDVAPFPDQAVRPDYWRALFDLNGHIVTLNVFGVPEAPYSSAAGRAVLKAFVARVRAASAAATTG
jgi:hypothetical protein